MPPRADKPDGIAGVAVDDDLALVHGIAAAVLRVAVDGDPRPVHESAEVVAGRAVYLDVTGSIQVGADIALAVDVVQLDRFNALRHQLPQPGVKVPVIDAGGIDGCG